MRERGKAVESFKTDGGFPDAYYYHSSSSELPCKKHPSASPVGVCAYCLNDRLMNLVCPECGEQRLSSCSCSDFSSGTADVGSVGRMSFLIENEKSNSEIPKQSARKAPKTEEVLFLKRSSSSCVEIKKKHKFWKIVGLLRKVHGKKGRDFEAKSVNHGGFDGRSDSWVVDYNNGGNFNGHMGVSRSRSLCSFRGGMLFGSEDGSYSRSSISAARSSSVNGGIGFDAEPRRSGFEGRKSNFSETEHRKSGFSETEPRRSCFEGRKSNFSETEHRKSGFSETEPRRSCFEGRRSNFSETEHRKSGFSETEPRRSCFEGRKSNFSETEHRKSGFSEVEPRRSCFEGRKSNFGETEHRKSGFSESEPRRSCFEGRKSSYSETEPRRSCFDGRRSNFSETEHRKSGFSETEPRRSCFEGRRSNFSESEQRKIGFDCDRRDSSAMDSDARSMRKLGLMDLDSHGLNRRVFSLKESYFTGGEDSGFIDLKFDLSSSESRTTEHYSAFGSMRCSDSFGISDHGDGVLDHGGGSCRESVGERRFKKSRRSFKGWRWMFRQSSHWNSGDNTRKKDEHVIVNTS